MQFEVVGVVGDAKYEDLRSAAPAAAYEAMTQNDKRAITVLSGCGQDGRICDSARECGARAREASEPRHSCPSDDFDGPGCAGFTQRRAHDGNPRRVLWCLCPGGYCDRLVRNAGVRHGSAHQRDWYSHGPWCRPNVQVVRMVFAQNTAVALVGTAAGLFAALLASRALASFLYSTSTRDPWVFAGSIAVLALIASAASLLPALRASRIDPMTAIRCE